MVQLCSARSGDLVTSLVAEWNKEKTWLVDVAVIVIDNGDLRLFQRTVKPTRRGSVPPVPPPRMTIREPINGVWEQDD